MARLIDADKLKPDIACHKQYTDQKYKSDRQWAIGYNAGIERALFSITYARTIEAEPVRHGKWLMITDSKHCGVCSVCFRQDYIDPIATHCRYCGAKMDLEG